MTNQLTEVTKENFFDTLCTEQKNILTNTIEGGRNGNFFPLTDIWYYAPNQSNVFGKTVEFSTTNKHLNKYYLASK
jgi:hypothetical protein